MSIEFLNLAIISALVPFCTGLVQLLKTDKWPSYLTKYLSLVVGLALAFLVREAGIQGVSEAMQNLYLCALTGIAVALTSSGLFGMVKTDVVKQIAKSESDITVPSELVGADKNDPKSVSNVDSSHF